VLIDGHNDLAWAHREAFGYDLDRGDIALLQPRLHTDLPRLARGGVQGQLWSLYVPSTLSEPQAVVATLEQIDFVHRLVARYDQLALATTADQVERAIADGRLASLLAIEGGHSIGSSLAVLRRMHALGVRAMTLTHNEGTAWADAATDEPAVGGLSDFGRAVVAEMNRLGMIVDLSHVAATTMRDALQTTSAPVIFSHSNARAVCDVPRNVPDDVLALVPGNGGIVMATFVSFLVTTAPRATLEDVVAQLDYLREVVGVAHIGIGGDFDGSDEVTAGLEDVASYPRLFAALRARAWSAAELDGLAGRNFLRVMRDVEAVAG
jgi:membrane dipeptidase